MANYRDMQAAKSINAAKHRIKQIYAHRRLPAPSASKLDAMARNATTQGGRYFDTIRKKPERYLPSSRTSSPSPSPSPSPRRSASSSGGGSGGSSGGGSSIANYQRTDQYHATDRGLAQTRIQAILRGAGVQVSSKKMGALVDNVMRQGWRYFDTIREDPQRYAWKGKSATRPGMEEADAGGSDAVEEEAVEEFNRDFAAEARALFPWLPPQLLSAFTGAYVEHSGNAAVAWGVVRQSPGYDDFFKGIKREDGSLRMTEQQWLGEMDGYRQAFESFGIPGDTFEDKFHKFIINGQSAKKVRQRLAKRYTEVASQAKEIKQFYAEHYGTGDISISAILASALDPSMNPMVAEEQFRISQVGGTGRKYGFDVGVGHAERLADFGMNRAAAQEFYGKAQGLVPTIQELAKRHADPDDDFDIDQAADALVFRDDETMDRIGRLFARDASSFTGTGGSVRMDEQGGLAGLRAR